jgi:hypothetical protein
MLMKRPSKQEIDDLRKQALIDAAYEASMRNTEAAPMPARPASAPMAPKKYAKGGSVSASKRADGCATKGKTRGKML